ncbi:hypothetical protein [Microbulbifer yueqingensis]|uniref:Uncharacterized protein n=1 Tax=Microbulbifer yueqingensis TaxID=658219 RepID=A0A1G9EIU1_9GAMM|nr:hypothetical protein [Microbulbifer yueqingensis]SDK75945.1 hypothetical protein SAMN05216212_3145 [Microbulbifer yueqingensis]
MTNDSELKLKLVADPELVYKGNPVKLTASVLGPNEVDYTDDYTFYWELTAGPDLAQLKGDVFKVGSSSDDAEVFLDTENMLLGSYTIKASVKGSNEKNKNGGTANDKTTARARKESKSRTKEEDISDLYDEVKITVQASAQAVLADQILKDGITVTSRNPEPSADQGLWVKLRECLEGRRFTEDYKEFIDEIMCGKSRRPNHNELDALPREPCAYRHGVNGYQLLKAATEAFLLCHACCDSLTEIKQKKFDADEERLRLGYSASRQQMQQRLKAYLKTNASPQTLPYLRKILGNLDLLNLKPDAYPYCNDSLRGQPCLFELIWSYWQEQGGLMQTINAITLRFQNRRVRPVGEADPLANLALDPLRPLNNLLWGYIQDTNQRLTVARRAYEYEHEYGLTIQGKAVGDLQPVERRARFLESFHALLHAASVFYHDKQNTMVNPDPFPILEKIRAVHLLLAEGAHNQFGDLPSTARAEMMLAQWLMAQQPMREFLQSRAMVPYAEPWMGQVDAMHKLMGWSDASATYFARLANYGEMILLSIRYGNWASVNHPAQAENWLTYWRAEIQGYIEAYRTVTGVDLAAKPQQPARINTTQPSELLQRGSQS